MSSEHRTKDSESVWPSVLRVRDTGLHDDMGGGGQRIYTTAGRGYETREYVLADAPISDSAMPVKSPRMICYQSSCQYEAMREENKQLRARIAELQNAIEAVRTQIGKSLRLL